MARFFGLLIKSWQILLVDPENFIPPNPQITPIHIQPEINLQKFDKYFFKVCPSGEISLNLVTLHDHSILHRVKIFCILNRRTMAQNSLSLSFDRKLFFLWQ